MDADSWDGRVLTVGPGDDTEYDSVQAAVEAADTGETVSVESAVYTEEVTLTESIRLVAPDGAILDGVGLGEPTRGTVHGLNVGEDTTGITIASGEDIAPEVVGFTVRGYELAVDADSTRGDWTLREVKLERNGEDGVSAIESQGAWSIHDSVLRLNLEEGIDGERTTGEWLVENTIIERNGDDGIDADGEGTTADWTLVDTTIRDNGDHGLELKFCSGSWTVRRCAIVDNDSGIGAPGTTGDWSVEASDLSRNHLVGLRCGEATGDWSVTDTLVEETSTAVWAPATTGDWTIERCFLGGTYYVPNDNLGEGTVLYAPYTTGEWSVSDCVFSGVERYGIDARQAEQIGDATGNWWMAPDSEIIENVGAVDCSAELDDSPVDRKSLVGRGASIATETAARHDSFTERSTAEIPTAELVEILAERIEDLHPSGGS